MISSIATFFTTALLAATFHPVMASTLSAQPDPESTDQAIHSVRTVIGLPGVKPGTEGTLSFTPRDLRFTTGLDTTRIPRRHIIAVTDGEERVETGGTTGTIARHVIPYGGGLALGAVTHKKVGILTVEFTDDAGQYHGAVFVLAAAGTKPLLAQFDTKTPPVDIPVIAAPAPCPAANVQANAVRVEIIGANLQSAFPAEDRVLLFEHLVQQLESEKTIPAVYRAGDQTPRGNCAEFTITVQAIAFTKGDQAVRASVGPLGHFVGATKLKYHLTVSTQDGTPILSKDMKNSEGWDSDSLNVTKGISKAVVKTLKKSRTELRKVHTA